MKIPHHCEEALLRGPVYPSLRGKTVSFDEANLRIFDEIATLLTVARNDGSVSPRGLTTG
ncbi:hypothetical protein [Rickettsia hoogstraalii]|uniref:hypothetical protein n=1 Tax=Rickettsia hoogstraalii TaxID=467174 RepID=UPI000AEF4BA8|nr:hypothetical protein [Rickettsia hoogstraalii]